MTEGLRPSYSATRFMLSPDFSSRPICCLSSFVTRRHGLVLFVSTSTTFLQPFGRAGLQEVLR